MADILDRLLPSSPAGEAQGDILDRLLPSEMVSTGKREKLQPKLDTQSLIGLLDRQDLSPELRSSVEQHLEEQEAIEPTGAESAFVLGAALPVAGAAGIAGRLLSGATAFATDPLIMQGIEEVSKEHPNLVIPAALLLSVVSAGVLEAPAVNAILRAGRGTGKRLTTRALQKSINNLSPEDIMKELRRPDVSPAAQKVARDTQEAELFTRLSDELVEEAAKKTPDPTTLKQRRVQKEVEMTEKIFSPPKKPKKPKSVRALKVDRSREEAKLTEKIFERKAEKTAEILKVKRDSKEANLLARILQDETGGITLPQKDPIYTGKAAKVQNVTKQAKELSKQQSRKLPKSILKSAKRQFIDTSGNVKAKVLREGGAEGKKVVINHDLLRGAHTKAMQDSNKAIEKVYGDLTQLEHKYFDDIVNAERSIDIATKNPKFKFSGGLTKIDFEEQLAQIPKEIRSKIKPKIEKYRKFFDAQLRELKDEGLLTQKEFDNIKGSTSKFSPRVILERIDPETGTGFTAGGRRITVPDSGIARLTDEGSLRLIEHDSSQLLSQYTSRIQTRIFRNRANKAAYKLAEANPNNGVFEINKIIRTTKAGKPVFAKAPLGKEKVKLRIDGKEKELLMSTDTAKEWITRDPILNQKQSAIIGWLSGTKILKTFATGLNPEFALTNLPRDIAHIWLTTWEHSNLMPLAALQLSKDITAVAGDTLKRSGRWTDYINEGGGMEFLTHQGRVTSKTKGALNKVQEVMGFFGETSEILTRLALRERTLKNKVGEFKTAMGRAPKPAELKEIQREATWVARNYLDFAQGGSFVKAADAAIPYLNAAIQGTRGLTRAAAAKPAQFTSKIAQVMALSSGLYLANRMYNQDTLREVNELDRANNFIITTPYVFKDKEGNTRHTFFKVAKDQGQRGVAAFSEALMAKAMGDEMDWDLVATAIQDAIPLLPADLLPPTLNAALGYAANKDFWHNEDIWKGGKVEVQDEWDSYTHPSFVTAGEKLNLSPKRLQAALGKVFTYNNVYTTLASGVMAEVFDTMTPSEKLKVSEQLFLDQPFIRRTVEATDPFTPHKKQIEQENIKERTKRLRVTRDFDELVQKVIDKEAGKSDIRTFIKEAGMEDKKRLVQRAKRKLQIQGMQEQRFWLNLAEMNPEARATVLYSRWLATPEAERKQLLKDAKRVPGVTSDRFIRRFGILKKQAKKGIQ